MRRIITGAAITPACLSLCRSALGFVSPALQHQSTGNRRQQLPTPGRAAGVAVVAPLSSTPSWPFANFKLWGRKVDEASPLGSEGLTLGQMTSPSDDRHGPPSIRNRGFILEEFSKWEGGGGSEGSMLDIASGTGCHVEAFAKALPGWTFQPSEVRRKHSTPPYTIVQGSTSYGDIILSIAPAMCVLSSSFLPSAIDTPSLRPDILTPYESSRDTSTTAAAVLVLSQSHRGGPKTIISGFR